MSHPQSNQGLNFAAQTKIIHSEMNIEEKISRGEFTVVDVRTPGEFTGGNVAGSINIPLNEVPNRLEELRGLRQPLVLCCASGNRSGQAEYYLSQRGIECINGGSWYEVNHLTRQTA